MTAARRAARLCCAALGLAVAVGSPAAESADEAPIVAEHVPPAVPVDDRNPEAAADEEPARLEDVVVTASKRELLQSELPGSVGVVLGQDLESLLARGMGDYLKLIPGVSFNDRGAESSVPLIRGIGTEIGFGTTAQTTGVFLDDMPLADLLLPLSLPDLSPYDLERVEVLKGPQGTLFGSGALAGAVRYVTRKPVLGAWEGKLMQSVSSARSSGGLDRVTAGAINAPLFGDALAIRAVALRQHGAGLYDMSATDSNGTRFRHDVDADRLDRWSGRGLVGWRPTERLGVTGLYFMQRTALADQPLADQAHDYRRTQAPFPSPRDHEFGGANASVEYDFDAARLLSSTSWLRKHNRLLTHSEWFFGLEDQQQARWYDLAIGDVDGLTHEFRLSSAADSERTWLVGASFLRYEGSYFQYEPEPGPAGDSPPSGPEDVSAEERSQSFLFATIDSVSAEQAAFGEVTQRLLDAWEFTGGLRLYRTRLIADTVLSGTQVVALTQQPESRGHFEPEADGANPKAAVRYLHSDEVSVYALVARGFQFGGVQVNPSAPLLSQSAAQAGFEFGPYRSSKLWNYELGMRATAWDGALRLDLTAFYLDWRDLQLTVRVPVLGTNATFGVIANVARAHSEGLESAVAWMPLKGLQLATTAAWTSAVTDVPFDEDNPAGPVPAGTRLPGTPSLQWTNGISYQRAMPGLTGWEMSGALLQSYVGSSPDAIRPTGSVGGYRTYDLRLSLVNPGLRLQPEIILGLTNLTDERAATYHVRLNSLTTNEPVDFYHLVPPRTAVVSLGVRY